MPAPLIDMLQRSRRLTSPVTTTATARSSTSGPLQRSRRLTSPVTGSERVRQQPPDASTEPETYVSGDLSQENKDAWRQVASTEPETYVSGDPAGAPLSCAASSASTEPETYVSGDSLPKTARFSRGFTAQCEGSRPCATLYAASHRSILADLPASKDFAGLRGVSGLSTAPQHSHAHQIAASPLGRSRLTPSNSMQLTPRVVAAPRSKMLTLSSVALISSSSLCFRPTSSTSVRSHTNTEYCSASPKSLATRCTRRRRRGWRMS